MWNFHGRDDARVLGLNNEEDTKTGEQTCKRLATSLMSNKQVYKDSGLR